MTKLAYAKVNIFLKIVGTRGSYHELSSRFMRVQNLYDKISFEPKTSKVAFELEGDFGCKKEQNTIYKAYQLLLNELKSPKLEKFFQDHKVKVIKNIPEFAGLGGGSSDAAAFLNLTNETLKLNLNTTFLAKLGAKIGADVPFFIHEFDSANVSGIGENVEKFDEEIFTIETFTPKIKCDTKDVYEKFRKEYLLEVNKDLSDRLSKLNSKEILDNFSAIELNDLFAPALALYPQLQEYHKKGWYFSGSGSTFFRGVYGKEKRE